MLRGFTIECFEVYNSEVFESEPLKDVVGCLVVRHRVCVEVGPAPGFGSPLKDALASEGSDSAPLKFRQQRVTEVGKLGARTHDNAAKTRGDAVEFDDPQAATVGSVGCQKAALEVGAGAVEGFGSTRTNVGKPARSLGDALKKFKIAFVGFAQSHFLRTSMVRAMAVTENNQGQGLIMNSLTIVSVD